MYYTHDIEDNVGRNPETRKHYAYIMIVKIKYKVTKQVTQCPFRLCYNCF